MGGVLSSKEFWAGDPEEDSHLEEKQADFNKLDTDSSGTLNIQELKRWESGAFHTEQDMKKLFEMADKDRDMMVTSEELHSARELIANSDAHYHFVEWAEHHEL